MHVRYTEKQASINDREKERIARRLGKVDKVLGPRGGAEAHVVFRRQRHVVEAEIAVRALRHTVVVTGSHADAYTALAAAIDKLHKQITKSKKRIIDSSRPERQRGTPAPVAASAAASAAPEPVPGDGEDVIDGGGVEPKPMTVQEAKLMLEHRDADHVAFRNVDSRQVCVLMRGRNGKFVLLDLPA